MARFLVGTTGGVDSSVAAWMLQRGGHEIVGVTLLFYACANEARRVERAAALCEMLGVEHHVVDARADFARLVLEPYLEAWKQGRVPDLSSLATCGLLVPRLLELAGELGCDKAATGHYARIARADAVPAGAPALQLESPRDRFHDETYYLHRLEQGQMAGLEFPLAEMAKPVARREAMRAGLMPLAPLLDDRAPFFLDGGDAASWVEAAQGLADGEGPVVDLGRGGREVARHAGLFRYAIGQRCPEFSGENGQPLYVVAKDMVRGVLYVGPALYAGSERCLVADVRWTSVRPPAGKRSCRVKVDFTRNAFPAQIVVLDGGDVLVSFNEAVRGVECGADCVFYSDSLVLGGGHIAG